MKKNILLFLAIAGIIVVSLWVCHKLYLDDINNDIITWGEPPLYATLPEGRSQCMGFEYETQTDDRTKFVIRQYRQGMFFSKQEPRDGEIWVMYVKDLDGYHRRVWGRLHDVGYDQADDATIFKYELAKKYVDGYAEYYGVKQSHKKIKNFVHCYYPRKYLNLQNSNVLSRLCNDMFEGFGKKDPDFGWWLKFFRTAYPILITCVLLAIVAKMIQERMMG
jgi:hypothetical protein